MRLTDVCKLYRFFTMRDTRTLARRSTQKTFRSNRKDGKNTKAVIFRCVATFSDHSRVSRSDVYLSDDKKFWAKLIKHVFLLRRLQVLCSCATSQWVPGSIPGGFTEDFFSGSFDNSMCPRVESASKNEYQDTPGAKGGRCVSVTTWPPS